MTRVWVGVDPGKEFHWAVVLNTNGEVLLSCRVENDQADLSALIDEALSFGLEIVWITDQSSSAVLLLALLWERDQRVLYASSVAVNRARCPSQRVQDRRPRHSAHRRTVLHAKRPRHPRARRRAAR